ncbi:10744_t:CDS:2, partial [Gigaspora rosea]
RTQMQLIYNIWEHLKQTKKNLQNFSDIHLLLIENNNDVITLKKLRESPKCLCHLSRTSTLLIQKLIALLKLLGSTFVDPKFEKQIVLKYESLDVIKQLPIFNEVNKDDAININSLDTLGRKNYLLPKEKELTYRLIISPSVFLNAHTSDDIRFQSPHIMDQIIAKLFEKWTTIKLFHSYLSKIAFVETSSGQKKPIELFDPNKI